MPRLPALALGLSMLAACSGEKLEEFTPASYIDRMRILGIQADPPEIQPGGTTHLRALVVDPEDGRQLSWVWVICDPDRTGVVGTPCGRQQSALELGELLEHGAEGIRLVPFVETLSYTAPEDTLDLHEPGSITRRRGLDAMIMLLVFEGTDPEALRDGNAEFQIALKRIRVVDPQDEANLNPRIAGVRLGEEDLPEDAGFEVPESPRLTFAAAASPDSVQKYVRVMPDGTDVEAEETVFFSWYTTAGYFDTLSRRGSRTEPDAPVDLVIPEGTAVPGNAVDVFAVLRDARGGIDWTRRTVLRTR